jgi:hypothetical protein
MDSRATPLVTRAKRSRVFAGALRRAERSTVCVPVRRRAAMNRRRQRGRAPQPGAHLLTGGSERAGRAAREASVSSVAVTDGILRRLPLGHAKHESRPCFPRMGELPDSALTSASGHQSGSGGERSLASRSARPAPAIRDDRAVAYEHSPAPPRSRRQAIARCSPFSWWLSRKTVGCWPAGTLVCGAPVMGTAGRVL